MRVSTLSLSSAEFGCVEGALRTLLSSCDYPTVDDWRLAVNRSLQGLLGAEMVTFRLQVPGVEEFLSEQFDHRTLKPYPAYLLSLEPLFFVQRKQVALGAWSRALLYYPNIRRLRRSAYYNEYLIPHRALDSFGLATRLNRGGMADIVLNYPHRVRSSVAKRNLRLLSLLLPVFKAGVRTCVQRAAHGTAVTSVIDGLTEGVFLADASGRTLHQNPALTRLLALDPERERLGSAVREIVCALVRFAGMTSFTGRDALPDPVLRALRTSAADYRLRGAYLTGALDGAGTIILVTVERADAEAPPPVSVLQEHGRLTERECQVAQLLILGRSDAVIGRTLGVSVHTARHHAESVRLKLGVHSRDDVELAVRQLLEGCPPGENGVRH